MADQIKALYTASFAPNPQLVDIFAREKGIDVEKMAVEVNILAADNRGGDLIKKNPAGQVPYFELNDGTVIAETIAMCEFLEEIQPSPALFGKTPAERANARMWQRRMEEHFHYPAFTAFRFWTASDDCKGPFSGFFKGKAPVLLPQVWKEQREWALKKLLWLEEEKKKAPSDFVAGDSITVADCQLYTTLKFFAVPDFGDFLTDNKNELPWTCAFQERMKARESVKASEAHIAALQAAAEKK